MKIEKLNENKIRITLDVSDLREKDIDYHSFMANSIDSQKLFLDVLDDVEEKIGFDTKDYKLKIEALATMEGEFILTITRFLPDGEQIKSKKPCIKRKNSKLNTSTAIYSFLTFDDFCNFCQYTNTSALNKLDNLSKNISLYTYNGKYYLVLNNINLEYKYLKTFYSSIIEFAHFVNNADLFEKKLQEYGKLIIKNKAIKTCLKHFVEN